MYPHYLQQFYNQHQAQQRKISELEKLVAQLQDDLTTLKQEPRTNIEHMEYKFDQLKIEKLDGTLNIGLTPGSGDLQDEFSVNGQNLQSQTQSQMAAQGIAPPSGVYPDVEETVRRNIAEYLSGHAWVDLKNIEKEQQHALDDPYRGFILEDIRKQVNPRIRHYLNQKKDGITQDNHQEISNRITQQVKSDIYEGMQNFIGKIKQGGEKS